MKAGASVRGMELTLEGSTLWEVLDTCDEATSFTSPMVYKRKRSKSSLIHHVVSLVDTTCPVLWFEYKEQEPSRVSIHLKCRSVASPHKVPGKTEKSLTPAPRLCLPCQYH